jgi:hypothetical protein
MEKLSLIRRFNFTNVDNGESAHDADAMDSGRTGDHLSQATALAVLSFGQGVADCARRRHLPADHESDPDGAEQGRLAAHLSGGQGQRKQGVHAAQVGRGETCSRCGRDTNCSTVLPLR